MTKMEYTPPKPLLARLLTMDLPPGQSAFLWGPRQTGKTTFLAQRFPDSAVFDLLDTDLFFALSKRPALLRELVLALPSEQRARPIVLDEVQKVPPLLDEVHLLIERSGLSFVLCGSSARKLVRGGGNLLGGRAWRFEMHPLVTRELPEWRLLDVLERGLLPSHFLGPGPEKSLEAYARDYMREEIFAEGLTRNAAAFSRFLDAVAYSNGELVNYANIARECGIDGKTVKEHFQILVDTLFGRLVPPFKTRQERQVIGKAPKFYLFDVGVAGALARRSIAEERGEQFGRALEHLVLTELAAHSSYSGLGYGISSWRTKTGIEVDFVLDRGEVAIEVKGTDRVDDRDLRGLRAFRADHGPRIAVMVCNERWPRERDGILLLPYREFLHRLWDGTIAARSGS
ncbi:MAG: AAA family ATPase [Polyangia bacterium]|nr:AAA family ATPase [Polyangia bacterium]